MAAERRLSILVVAHDTGGAQILAAMMRDEFALHAWTAAALPDSPADRLFRRYAPDCPLVDFSTVNAGDIIEKIRPDVLIAGTSLHNTELPFIREARKRGITTIAVLDHWINYRERFGFPGADWLGNVPDIVCATDGTALALALEAGFPRVEPLKNYYLADILNSFNALPAAEKRDILLLSQVVPLGDGQVHGVHQAAVAVRERQIVEEFATHFEKLAGFLGAERLVVRLHPAQPSLLYEDIQERCAALVVERASSRELMESLRCSRIVAGCSSMALFTATALGLETYSFSAGGYEELPAVGHFVFEAVEDIITGKCTLSAFGHNNVYMDNNCGIAHLLRSRA